MRSIRSFSPVLLLSALLLAACPGGPDGSAPRITDTSLPVAVVGVPYTALLEVTGGSGAKRWSLTEGGLPAGIALSAGGRLEGTPLSSGAYPLGLEVLDEAGQRDQATLLLEVSEPLVLTGAALPAGAIGTALLGGPAGPGRQGAFHLRGGRGRAADGAHGPRGHASRGSPRRPARTASSWRSPTPAGSARVRPSRSRSKRTMRGTSPPRSCATRTAPRPTPSSSQRLAQARVAWSLVGGALPAGLSLSSSGLIPGAPTAAGSSSFTVQASRDGQRTSRTFDLRVRATHRGDVDARRRLLGNGASHWRCPPAGARASSPSAPPGDPSSRTRPVPNGNPRRDAQHVRRLQRVGDGARRERTERAGPRGLEILQPPELTGGALPDAELGQPFDASLDVSQGRAPLAYAVTAGALPRGVSLSPRVACPAMAPWSGRAPSR